MKTWLLHFFLIVQFREKVGINDAKRTMINWISRWESITNAKLKKIDFFSLVCSDFRPSTLEKVQELVRLRIYQAYAFGLPLVIMAIAIILDNLPNGEFLRPKFGQTRCGFDGKLRLYNKRIRGLNICFFFQWANRELQIWSRDLMTFWIWSFGNNFIVSPLPFKVRSVLFICWIILNISTLYKFINVVKTKIKMNEAKTVVEIKSQYNKILFTCGNVNLKICRI